MPDLTELQRLAEGAERGPWEHDSACESLYSATGFRIADFPCVAPQNERRQIDNAAYIAAMHPDTAKKLIAVALAAQAAYTFLADQGKAVFAHGGMPAVDRLNATALALRTALEELAGSPQERRE